MEQAFDHDERPGVALLYAGFFPRYNLWFPITRMY
jgi:hypothetical protein